MTPLIWFAIGFSACFVIFAATRRYRASGILRVDRTDPDGQPYLFLEIGSLTDISTRKYITLRVSVENCIPQKNQTL